MPRKVFIKNLNMFIRLKNVGLELHVTHSNGSHKGDLYISRKGLIWCRGKTKRENGKEIGWHDFADYMEHRISSSSSDR